MYSGGVNDPYGNDVLSNDPHRDRRPHLRSVAAVNGLVVEDVGSGYVGAIVGLQKTEVGLVVALEDRRRAVRYFSMTGRFWIDGEEVELVRPPTATDRKHRSVTHSGSFAAPEQRAKVASASRIWVEGKHDAELVEYVWGDDLRDIGVVVELLDGVDNLEARLDEFEPNDRRRVGVLVDHLVRGSKESRIAAHASAAWGGSVLVLGHPYVDVWQAIKPGRFGLDRWPDVPRGVDIKRGTLAALGWPNETVADVARGWQRILARVRDFHDLEPSLLGRVEQLIDFVSTTR